MAEHDAITPAELAAYGLTSRDAELLLDIAETAIRARLSGHPTPAVDTRDLPARLVRPNPAFVTLHVAGELNGCIGDLGGSVELAASIAELAIKSAFADPRLPVLRSADLARLDIEISLLSRRVAVPARSRHELVEHLRPAEHGLVLTSRRRSALFLPSVWQQLPDPDDFVDRLLLKAAMPRDRWPDDLLAEVFTTASFHRTLGR